MIVGGVQRWRARRGVYRPAGEPIRTADFEVAAIDEDRVAKRFVLEHHYEGSYVPARARFGLYRGSELAGVAVFSVPVNARALDPAPGDAASRACLGRLVLLDDVAANGESWFIARCFELLQREGYTGIVSFADPQPRLSEAGDTVFRGHLGTIYQATNGVYVGRSKADTRRLLPDGTVLHNRLLAKIRKLDRGWRYGVELLERHGAGPLEGDPREWLAEWLPRITRRQRHRGNLKYVWALNKRDRRWLPDSLPYPKLIQEPLLDV